MPGQRETASVQFEKSRENHLMGMMIIIVRVLTGKGVNNAAAVRLAMDIIRELTDSLGGTTIYLSKQSTVKQAEKAAAILAEFDGMNHAALAEKFGLSSRMIYLIVNRASERKSMKPDIAGVAVLLQNRQRKDES